MANLPMMQCGGHSNLHLIKLIIILLFRIPYLNDFKYKYLYRTFQALKLFSKKIYIFYLYIK